MRLVDLVAKYVEEKCFAAPENVSGTSSEQAVVQRKIHEKVEAAYVDLAANGRMNGHYLYEERAGIMEIGGGVSREKAEKVAEENVRDDYRRQQIVEQRTR